MHKNRLVVNGNRMVVYKMQNIVDKKEKKYYYTYDGYRKKKCLTNVHRQIITSGRGER